MASNTRDIINFKVKYIFIAAVFISTKELQRGEEAQPQQFLVWATFFSFSRPSHLGILVLIILC